MTTETTLLDQAQSNMISALEKMILFAVDSAEQAGEMLSEQVPEVVMQLLTWHAIKYGINALVGLVFIAVAIWVTVHVTRQFAIAQPASFKETGCNKWAYSHYYNKWRTRDSWDLIITGKAIIAVIFGASGAITMYTNMMLALYIIVAPKVYLIEYGVDLVRKLSGN